MSTEQILWQALREAAKGWPGRCTRIETGDTAIGVSDIEYVTPAWAGWVESKVLVTSRDTSVFSFNSEFSRQQFQWLVEHHNPRHFRASWLLVGKPKRANNGWESWLMLPAPITLRLLKTLRPTNGEVLNWPEVVVAATPQEVLTRLSKGI